MRRSAWIKLFILLIFLPSIILLAWRLTRGTVDATLTPRTPAATGGATRTHQPKVELNRAHLVTSSSISPNQQGVVATSQLAVPAGTRLMAVVDNDCLANKPENAVPSLSEKAFDAAEKDGPEDLKFQAYSFKVNEAYSVDQLINEAEADNCVQSVTQDRILKLIRPHTQTISASGTATSEASPTQQGHLDYLKAKDAWSLLFNSGHAITKDVVVAVVDSGVDYNHPDLAGNMWRNANGNTGFDFIHNNEQPMDDLNHGTHVAGLIGAIDNAIGVTGIMNKHIKIMAVKIINSSDEGTLSDLVNGLHYAADHGADIINLSLGGEGTSSSEEAAVRYATSKGCIVVVAAGNSGKNVTASTADYPAGYAPDVPGMLAVGSIDSGTGIRSDFTNYSPSFVYIAAPGSEDSAAQRGLLSTLPNSTYGRMEGTSMATPVVVGALALIVGVVKSEGLTVSNADMVDTLLASARNENSLLDYFKNGNVLDLARLAQVLKYRYIIEGDAGAEDAQ